MNINKQKLQVQIGEGSVHAVNCAIALSFAEKIRLQSGLTDWAQTSARPAV